MNTIEKKLVAGFLQLRWAKKWPVFFYFEDLLGASLTGVLRSLITNIILTAKHDNSFITQKKILIFNFCLGTCKKRFKIDDIWQICWKEFNFHPFTFYLIILCNILVRTCFECLTEYRILTIHLFLSNFLSLKLIFIYLLKLYLDIQFACLSVCVQ